MGVSCQLLFHYPTEGFFRPGYFITGIVKYTVDEDTEYKNIQLSLKGEGRCEWKEKIANTATTAKENIHYTLAGPYLSYEGKETILNIKTSILNKENGKGDSVVVPAGLYEHSFDFHLPPHLPPSFKDKHALITYCIKVKFYRPGFFKFTKKFYTEILLKGLAVPPAPPAPVIYKIEKTLLKLFSSKKKIHVKAELQNPQAIAGEPAEINFNVSNETKVIIPCIAVDLIERTMYTASCGTKKKKYRTIGEAKTPSVADKSTADLVLSVPSSPEIFSILNSKVVQRKYKLRVTVKLPLPYMNASIKIPIEYDTYRQRAPVPAIDEVSDAPPSYWQVMAEDHGQETSK